MNILAIAAHGFYEDYSSSFVHNQLKTYVKLGHNVRVLVFVAAGKKSPQIGGIVRPVVPVIQDGVEIFYVRYLSLGHYGENSFNPVSAKFIAELMAKLILRGFEPDVIQAHGILFAGPIAIKLKKYCHAQPCNKTPARNNPSGCRLFVDRI